MNAVKNSTNACTNTSTDPGMSFPGRSWWILWVASMERLQCAQTCMDAVPTSLHRGAGMTAGHVQL